MMETFVVKDQEDIEKIALRMAEQAFGGMRGDITELKNRPYPEQGDVPFNAGPFPIPSAGDSFPWDMFAFGFKPLRLATEDDTGYTVGDTICEIIPGEVRMHGLRTYTGGGGEIKLTGAIAVVHLAIGRTSGGTMSLACDVSAETDGSTLRLPLHTFEQEGAVYVHKTCHNLGDFNFAAPIR